MATSYINSKCYAHFHHTKHIFLAKENTIYPYVLHEVDKKFIVVVVCSFFILLNTKISLIVFSFYYIKKDYFFVCDSYNMFKRIPLLRSQMIYLNRYCSKLNQLKVAVDKKHLWLANRKSIIFYQDNSRPHVSLVTSKKIVRVWMVNFH